MSEVSSATIQERLDQLAAEQARREREIAEHTVALGELDRQRAVLDVAQQLDGGDSSSALKALVKERAAATERLDALQAELTRSELERAELAHRHAEAQRHEVQAERARLAAEYAVLADRAAALLAELAAVQQRGWLLRGEDERLREHPLLKDSKGRPAPRGSVYTDLGPTVTVATGRVPKRLEETAA